MYLLLLQILTAQIGWYINITSFQALKCTLNHHCILYCNVPAQLPVFAVNLREFFFYSKCVSEERQYMFGIRANEMSHDFIVIFILLLY